MTPPTSAQRMNEVVDLAAAIRDQREHLAEMEESFTRRCAELLLPVPAKQEVLLPPGLPSLGFPSLKDKAHKSKPYRNGAKAKKVTAKKPRKRFRGAMTRWVADARARRVPLFVIEHTGLDTKKKIVAKYGAGVLFEKTKQGNVLIEKRKAA